jgi:hypothetical protein
MNERAKARASIGGPIRVTVEIEMESGDLGLLLQEGVGA